MKLKKGSLEAKRFMAKIRAKKGKPKKVSGVKKPSVKKTHTDIKSHNYKISISGTHKSVLQKFKIPINLKHTEKIGYVISLMQITQNKVLNREKITPLEEKLFNYSNTYGFHLGSKKIIKDKII